MNAITSSNGHGSRLAVAPSPKARKAPKPTPGVVSPWYRTADLMQLFGVTDRTIQKWVAMGRIPEPIRKGRGWVRWPKKQIDALLESWGKGGQP